jgi:hypothetical protein
VSAGDTLRGLVFRLRAARADWDAARAALLRASSPDERERCSERLGATMRIRGGIETDVLRRMCDGGVELDEVLAVYGK